MCICGCPSLPQGFWERRWEEKERVQDAAFVAHHIHREKAANVYANTRRVAGIMTAFEDDDYKLQVCKCVYTLGYTSM